MHFKLYNPINTVGKQPLTTTDPLSSNNKKKNQGLDESAT